ncbi:MAG TPA: succinate dehydrogenase, partial [Halococcus sp.]|nr:succinate dehydrogenase [Halococcus sp.]
MAERYSSFDRRGWQWFVQRITAAFLIVVLAFHFMVEHFINHAAEITFMGSHARMSQVGYFITMVLFLITAAFHGVNGVYNALVNQGLDGTQKTVVLGVLVVASVALVVQGVRLAFAMTG